VVTTLKPLIVLFTPLLVLLMKIIRGVVWVLTKMREGMNKVVAMFLRVVAIVWEALEPVVRLINVQLADALKGMIKYVRQAADNLERNDPFDQAMQFNRAFLDALSTVSKQSKPTPEEQKDKESPESATSIVRRVEDQRKDNRDSLFRVPESAPRPHVPDIRQTVNFNLQMQMLHEEAVQRAIEQVRSALIYGWRETRNEQLMIAGLMQGQLQVDIVRGR
jgi:hypothetical protein